MSQDAKLKKYQGKIFEKQYFYNAESKSGFSWQNLDPNICQKTQKQNNFYKQWNGIVWSNLILEIFIVKNYHKSPSTAIFKIWSVFCFAFKNKVNFRNFLKKLKLHIVSLHKTNLYFLFRKRNSIFYIFCKIVLFLLLSVSVVFIYFTQSYNSVTR